MPLALIPPATLLRVLTLNIAAAAVARAEAILGWLIERDDDVIVLTETSAGAGSQLLAGELRGLGYSTYGRSDPRDRGVLVATRAPVARELELGLTLPWRGAGVVLDAAQPIALVGVYVPSRDRSDFKVTRKAAFIRSLLDGIAALPSELRERLLLLGDYNAVRRDHEPRLPGFFAYEYELHDRLEAFGLSPAHELLGASEQQHSWIGRTGIGYLYDYVHVGSGLHGGVERTAYLHGTREQRLSDHAAVAAGLRLG